MAFQANMNSQFAKTKMCKFELIGCCLKGSSCQFAHEASQLQPLPDLSRTKLCPMFVQDGVCSNPGCTFAHDKIEIRATNAFHKTKMCRFFPSGRCERGSQCTFAHAPDELHVQETDGVDNKLQARPKPHVVKPPVMRPDSVQSTETATAEANKPSASLASLQENTLPASLDSYQEEQLIPAISLLIDRLGDLQGRMMAKKLNPEMMDAETATQYSDSQGNVDGTSTPTSSEDDQLLGEAMNAHLPSRTLHLFPFVAQKPNPLESPSMIAPPPGLELYVKESKDDCKSGDVWQTVGVGNGDRIWETENIFCDL